MPSASPPAIAVENVSKKFRLYHERNQSLKAALMRGRRASFDSFLALDDVTFDIPVGSTFGLIGENGSGKSTLLKCLAKILRPDTGTVTTHGSLAALLELGSGFHQELSGRENVYLNGSILGMSKAAIDASFDKIVDFAGIGAFIDQPVKNYSSGMYVRLGFSVAINVEPDILLVDEVLAVGDANFQQKCMDKFADFRNQGRTVVIVSHAMSSMRSMCDHVAWLQKGKLLDAGDARTVVDQYVDESFTDRAAINAETAAAAASDGTTPEYAQHSGSGEITLTGLQLLDRVGEPVTTIRTGDRITMRLHFDAHQQVDNVTYALRLLTREGDDLWTYNTRDAGMSIDQKPGKGYVDLLVPQLLLQSGAYDVVASARDASSLHPYDYVRPIHRFDVADGPHRESGGPLALGTSWTPPVLDDSVSL